MHPEYYYIVGDINGKHINGTFLYKEGSYINIKTNEIITEDQSKTKSLSIYKDHLYNFKHKIDNPKKVYKNV